VQNHIVTSHEKKLQAAFEFYTELLGIAIDRNFSLDLVKLRLLHHDLSSLEAPFSEEEVW
jgi:predicted enzyme related to lactoylglutathione lyase